MIVRKIFNVLLFLIIIHIGFNSAFGENTGSVDFSKKIAFTANMDGNWDLFVMDEDGTNVVRLTETPYDEGSPQWSPDRKNILYSTSDGQLNIIDVETKEVKHLSIEGKDGKKTSASFSPDGKEIIFVYFKPGALDDTELCIYNLEDGNSKTLLDQCGGQYFPRWSTNGDQIVYTHIHCSSGCGQIIQELWVADSRGGNARQLLMTNSLCMQPAWSKDGKKIAFSSDKTGNFDIWIYSQEDSKLEQLTTDPNLDVSPAWSPDGSKIAFVSTRSGKMDIWIRDIKSGKEKMINPFPGKNIECKDVAW